MPRRLVILTKLCFDLSIYWSRSTFADIYLSELNWRDFSMSCHMTSNWTCAVGIILSEARRIFVMEGKWWFGSSNFYGFCGFWRLLKQRPRSLEQNKVPISHFPFLFRLNWWICFFRKIDRVMFVSNSSAVDRTAYRTSSYGGRVTTRYFHEAKPIKHQNTPSEGVLKTYYGRKNSKMNSKRRVSQLKPKRNNTTRQTRNSLSSTVHEDLPELYILVLVSHVHFRWFHKCIRNPAGCLFVKSVFF